MTPEELRNRSAALAERVRHQVNSQQRLQMMLRAHRRRRRVALALATAMILAVVVGALVLTRTAEPPVVTVPPTTRSTVGELGSLPVEVFVVLEREYTVDGGTGTCEGSGPLAGIAEGSSVHVQDESANASADDARLITLPAGAEVTGNDPRASFLVRRDGRPVCVFVLPDLGYDIAEYEHINLFLAPAPDLSMSQALAGQRVIFRFGASP